MLAPYTTHTASTQEWEYTMKDYERAIELVQAWYGLDRQYVIHYFWDEVIAAMNWLTMA
jgi:hypothetical protein